MKVVKQMRGIVTLQRGDLQNRVFLELRHADKQLLYASSEDQRMKQLLGRVSLKQAQLEQVTDGLVIHEAKRPDTTSARVRISYYYESIDIRDCIEIHIEKYRHHDPGRLVLCDLQRHNGWLSHQTSNSQKAHTNENTSNQQLERRAIGSNCTYNLSICACYLIRKLRINRSLSFRAIFFGHIRRKIISFYQGKNRCGYNMSGQCGNHNRSFRRCIGRERYHSIRLYLTPRVEHCNPCYNPLWNTLFSQENDDEMLYSLEVFERDFCRNWRNSRWDSTLTRYQTCRDFEKKVMFTNALFSWQRFRLYARIPKLPKYWSNLSILIFFSTKSTTSRIKKSFCRRWKTNWNLPTECWQWINRMLEWRLHLMRTTYPKRILRHVRGP